MSVVRDSERSRLVQDLQTRAKVIVLLNAGLELVFGCVTGIALFQLLRLGVSIEAPAPPSVEIGATFGSVLGFLIGNEIGKGQALQLRWQREMLFAEKSNND